MPKKKFVMCPFFNGAFAPMKFDNKFIFKSKIESQFDNNSAFP